MAASIWRIGVDIGGSGIKGCLVDLEQGKLIGERMRLETPQPSLPDAVYGAVAEIVNSFGWTGRVGVTFPGVMKDGVAERYVRGRNAAASPYRFELDVPPATWFLEDDGYELAVFHSHPSSPPRPSRTDVEAIGLWEGQPYVILSLRTGELAGWRIAGGISHTIAANTTIPAGGYLVVFASTKNRFTGSGCSFHQASTTLEP